MAASIELPAGGPPGTPWLAGAGGERRRRPAPADGSSCDVCIVGGGVSGLAVGLELAERGRDVLLLEAGEVGGGETARSSAHLVTALDERYFKMERAHGAEAAREAARGHAGAIAWIRRAVARHRIECGLEGVVGLLAPPSGDARRAGALLEAEMAAATRAGVACSRMAPGEGLPAAFEFGGLCFPGQAQVQPVELVRGLADAFERHGGRLCCSTPVRRMERAGAAVELTTGDGVRVRAGHVVLATHAVPGAMARGLRPMRPRVSSVIACAWAGEGRFLLWDGYWDGPAPYHYVRTARAGGENLLIVGGEDEAGAAPADAAGAYDRLEAWARAHFGASVGARGWAWWGRILEPEGEFALIGEAPGWPGVSVVTGDSGNGMTYAAIAAVRLADQLEGFPAPAVQERMYAPGRRDGEG